MVDRLAPLLCSCRIVLDDDAVRSRVLDLSDGNDSAVCSGYSMSEVFPVVGAAIDGPRPRVSEIGS